MRAIKPHIRLLDLAQLSCAGCAQHGQCAAEESRATHRARARGARSRDAASAANTIMRIGRCDAATRAARARPAHRGEQRARMGSPARGRSGRQAASPRNFMKRPFPRQIGGDAAALALRQQAPASGGSGAHRACIAYVR